MRSPPAHYYVPPIWGAATHHLGRAGGTGRVLGPAALQAQQGLEAQKVAGRHHKNVVLFFPQAIKRQL